MMNILLADDDIELTEMLVEYLGKEDFTVDVAHDGKTALEMAISGEYELVILDVMMPELNGFDVLRQIRTQSQVPVLMLTARGDDVDSVIGLEIGADDYLAKPCNPRVLVAHMRAILRRSDSPDKTPGDETTDLTIGDLTLQPGQRRVLLNTEPVSMTSTEYSVLAVLLSQAGHVISKQALTEQALGRKLSPYDRSLDMHVSNLRKKLGTYTDGSERILTVRGVGYQYVSPSDE